jgi:hypothetical protein
MRTTYIIFFIWLWYSFKLIKRIFSIVFPPLEFPRPTGIAETAQDNRGPEGAPRPAPAATEQA